MRKFSSVLAGLSLATGLSLVPAASASALPSCTGISRYVSTSNSNLYHYAPTTRPNSWNRYCVLGYGNSGVAVEEVQRALHVCYGQTQVKVDGIYGSKTRSAVRWMQGQIGATQDGVFGPETASKMKWMLEIRFNNSESDSVCQKAW